MPRDGLKPQFTCQTKIASSYPPLPFFDITLYFLKAGGTLQPAELIEKQDSVVPHIA